tara:strand:- start:24 stop:695 length:672 start_codon:yes stop_codon:yes gene_type:complete
MRSWENREDTTVSDEPFYGAYLKETGLDHPGRDEIVEVMESDWENVVKFITGPIPDSKTIWYQKQMAHHMLADWSLDWLEKVTNCFLIRDPKEVILSYSKKFEIRSLDLLGYRRQAEIFDLVKEITGEIPIVLDAKDVLSNPEGILKKMCNKLRIPFSGRMLSWLKGKRDSDGVWGKYWYQSVENSTGFKPYMPNDEPLLAELISAYNQCKPLYERLYQFRLI